MMCRQIYIYIYIYVCVFYISLLLISMFIILSISQSLLKKKPMDDVEQQVVQTNETKNLWMMCSIRSFKPMRQNRTAREGLHSTNTSKLVGEQNGKVKFTLPFCSPTSFDVFVLYKRSRAVRFFLQISSKGVIAWSENKAMLFFPVRPLQSYLYRIPDIMFAKYWCRLLVQYEQCTRTYTYAFTGTYCGSQ